MILLYSLVYFYSLKRTDLIDPLIAAKRYGLSPFQASRGRTVAFILAAAALVTYLADILFFESAHDLSTLIKIYLGVVVTIGLLTSKKKFN